MRRGRGTQRSEVPTVRLAEAGERMMDGAPADVKAGRVRAYESVDELMADRAMKLRAARRFIEAA